MGDHVSKLKLLSATDGDMEERYFLNRCPDWAPTGVATSDPEADGGSREPLDADGEVRMIIKTIINYYYYYYYNSAAIATQNSSHSIATQQSKHSIATQQS